MYLPLQEEIYDDDDYNFLKIFYLTTFISSDNLSISSTNQIQTLLVFIFR